MTTEHTPGGLIGRSVRRVEDPVLITGKGCYVDDIQLPGVLHMAFLRSPYPYANILSIHVRAAQALPGVVTVVTGDDLSERLHVPVMPLVPGMKIPPHPLLARGAVHAVGAPVAAVVAHSRALAQDAAAAVTVEYDALPAVVNAEKALEPGAPPAVANAVMDALAPLGIDHIDMPYTAPKLWEAIQAASGTHTQ